MPRLWVIIVEFLVSVAEITMIGPMLASTRESLLMGILMISPDIAVRSSVFCMILVVIVVGSIRPIGRLAIVTPVRKRGNGRDT